jgi:hypothetical protein
MPMRWLIVGLTLSVLAGCTPLVVGADPRGGVVTHVITVGPFHNEDQALLLAEASCRQYGRTARMVVPVTAIDGGDSTLSFDCVRPQ